jgi:hypothetical protein
MGLRPEDAGNVTQDKDGRYVNMDQAHRDDKVEAVLCVGGPIIYELVDNTGVTAPWLKEHVVPGIMDFYHNK